MREEQRDIAHCSHSRALQEKAALLAKPSGFEGFGMSQKVADPSNLPRSKLDEFSYFLAELDPSRAGSGRSHASPRYSRHALRAPS
jgi:hypothetical protein